MKIFKLKKENFFSFRVISASTFEIIIYLTLKLKKAFLFYLGAGGHLPISISLLLFFFLQALVFKSCGVKERKKAYTVVSESHRMIIYICKFSLTIKVKP